MEQPIDLMAPETKPLTELLELLPDPKPSKVTVWRWHSTGVGGRKLRVARYRRKLYSTAAELRDFVNYAASVSGRRRAIGPPPMDPERRAAMDRRLDQLRGKRGSVA